MAVRSEKQLHLRAIDAVIDPMKTTRRYPLPSQLGVESHIA
jgi:hypothetical protein